MVRRIFITIALFGLSLFGLIAPAPTSAASALAVDVTSATVVVRGVAVDLTATVVCPTGMTGDLALNVTQRSGSSVAQGSGWAAVTCTGESQTVTQRALAQAGGSIFRPGEAIIIGQLGLCDEFQCEYVQVNDTIRVTRN